MSYRVEVDAAPAYELLVSLRAFCDRPNHKILELGRGWVEQVHQRLPHALVATLQDFKEPWRVPLLPLLIWQCPGERDAASFLPWLASLSAGELYERLQPYESESYPIPPDLGRGRDRYVDVLTQWNEHYFQSVDPRILDGLLADAAAKRELAKTAKPDALVEEATNGVTYQPPPDGPPLNRALLIPQYHGRPINLLASAPGLIIFLYPADALPTLPGEPPAALLRLTRALGDESRLRLLRHLREGERTFTELAQWSHLSQSTVYHHVVTLRAAGLLRARISGEAARYSLRPRTPEMVARHLAAFLHAGPYLEHASR